VYHSHKPPKRSKTVAQSHHAGSAGTGHAAAGGAARNLENCQQKTKAARGPKTDDEDASSEESRCPATQQKGVRVAERDAAAKPNQKNWAALLGV
jgi:hypothetical protein